MEKVFGEIKMFNDEIMDKILKKCEEDPEFKKVFEQLFVWSQKAAITGMTTNEMANICMMGFAIGQDPELRKMIENMMRISDIGLDIVDK